MVRTRVLLSVTLACFLAFTVSAQQKSNIEGVWHMLSQKVDGKEMLTASATQMKYITAKHWIFIDQDKAKTIAALAKKSQGDPVKAYQDAFGAGAGTYKLIGNTYTETIEQFPDPAYIGMSISFTVKVEGDRFHQSGKYPVLENGKKVRDVILEEVYERVE
jgi:hypothetical protein